VNSCYFAGPSVFGAIGITLNSFRIVQVHVVFDGRSVWLTNGYSQSRHDLLPRMILRVVALAIPVNDWYPATIGADSWFTVLSMEAGCWRWLGGLWVGVEFADSGRFFVANYPVFEKAEWVRRPNICRRSAG